MMVNTMVVTHRTMGIMSSTRFKIYLHISHTPSIYKKVLPPGTGKFLVPGQTGCIVSCLFFLLLEMGPILRKFQRAD